jgi:anti-sigma regulatory factor (Ser/Thr protein kinase)
VIDVVPTAAEPELPGSFTRSFLADVSAPGGARHALQELSGDVDEGLLERGCIVVTELVTNCVRHARLAPEQQIDLRVSARRQLLRLEVIDEGDGFEPVATRPDPEVSSGGWGLWMVAQLADRWGVDTSHSTRVWCELESRARPALSRAASSDRLLPSTRR